MGTEGSPVPNSTRDINGDAHLDDIFFLFTWQQVNYDSTFLITS